MNRPNKNIFKEFLSKVFNKSIRYFYLVYEYVDEEKDETGKGAVSFTSNGFFNKKEVLAQIRKNLGDDVTDKVKITFQFQELQKSEFDIFVRE